MKPKDKPFLRPLLKKVHVVDMIGRNILIYCKTMNMLHFDHFNTCGTNSIVYSKKTNVRYCALHFQFKDKSFPELIS